MQGRATYSSYSQYPLPREPRLASGESGCFFWGAGIQRSGGGEAFRPADALGAHFFDRNRDTWERSRTLHLYIQISPSQGDPAALKVSRVTYLGGTRGRNRNVPRGKSFRLKIRHIRGIGATNKKRIQISHFPGRPGSSQDEPGHFFLGRPGAQRPNNSPQTGGGHHLPVHQKSIPFPGSPGSPHGEPGCFFWGAPDIWPSFLKSATDTNY